MDTKYAARREEPLSLGIRVRSSAGVSPSAASCFGAYAPQQPFVNIYEEDVRPLQCQKKKSKWASLTEWSCSYPGIISVWGLAEFAK